MRIRGISLSFVLLTVCLAFFAWVYLKPNEQDRIRDIRRLIVRDPAKAFDQSLSLLERSPQSPELLLLTADAAEAAGDTAEALRFLHALLPGHDKDKRFEGTWHLSSAFE